MEDPHIVVRGDGLPTFLFVHGFGCALDDWAAQLAALPARHRCIALDLPGHGGSAVPKVATLATLARAVNRAKEETAARDVILVGHSLGAKVVREAYARSAADVVGLVMIEGRYYAGDTPTLVASARSAIDGAGFAAFAQRFFSDMFRDGDDSRERDHVLARLRRFDPAYGRDLYLDSIGWDDARGIETLEGIRVPTLVMQSTAIEQGKRVPLKPGMTTPFMNLVARAVPRARLTVIPGCAHFPMFEAPDAVNRALLDFAASVAASMPPSRGRSW